jgi:transcriptional regulator with XRE-family HTH domain
MTLKEFANIKNMTLTEIARQLSYSRVHLTNVANGAPAGKKLTKKLVIWSSGALKADDLLYPDASSFTNSNNQTKDQV